MLDPASITTTEKLALLSREELKQYILSIQSKIQGKLKSGATMDDILDETDPFELIEPYLPVEIFPILVLAIVNNVQSDTVLDPILEALGSGLKSLGNEVV